MKNKIAFYHHREFIHMKCCYQDLYDINLRIEYLDHLEIMKKHPMTHELSIFQRISFFFHHLDFFVYVVDLEVVRKTFESMRNTYELLMKLEANQELLDDYAHILTSLQKSLLKFGHLD